jgi:hypothetical protein
MRGAFAPKQAAGPAAAAAAIDPTTLRATPFTDDQLLAVWNQYIEMNPKAHVLCNTMRAALPSRKAPESPELRMIVANQPQVDFMEQELPGLLTYLRNTLANDHIRVSVEVNNDPNAPAAWNDRDLLRHIVESNPHAASFIADFNLTISEPVARAAVNHGSRGGRRGKRRCRKAANPPKILSKTLKYNNITLFLP